MKNYFVNSKLDQYYFFDDASMSSTTRAYAAAIAQREVRKKGHVALYRPTMIDGVWNRCPLVGHRDREDIEKNIEELQTAGAPPSDERLARRLAELDSLNERFLDVIGL